VRAQIGAGYKSPLTSRLVPDSILGRGGSLTGMKKYLLLVLSIVLSAGCVGSNFTWDQVRQVKNGMTEPEVRHIMGPPQILSVETNQIRLVYAESSPFGDTRMVTLIFVNGIVTNFPVLPPSW
jgi:hypothetical protein